MLVSVSWIDYRTEPSRGILDLQTSDCKLLPLVLGDCEPSVVVEAVDVRGVGSWLLEREA